MLQNAYKNELEAWDKRIKKQVPDADVTVLQFITDLVCCAAKTEAEYEIIRSTFRAGYCWHFAHLLKNAFQRGEVCWAAPFGHFVWLDNNGIPYDVEGVNFGEQLYHIPESYLGDHIKDFTHIPGDKVTPATEEDVIAIIRKYEDDNHLPHETIRI